MLTLHNPILVGRRSSRRCAPPANTSNVWPVPRNNHDLPGKIIEITQPAALDAQRLSNDKPQVTRLLNNLPSAPPLTWGRDELRSGDLWNSNSLNLGCLGPRLAKPAKSLLHFVRDN
jgi:hypothetical protein